MMKIIFVIEAFYLFFYDLMKFEKKTTLLILHPNTKKIHVDSHALNRI